jgi:hypothetical protein
MERGVALAGAATSSGGQLRRAEMGTAERAARTTDRGKEEGGTERTCAHHLNQLGSASQTSARDKNRKETMVQSGASSMGWARVRNNYFIPYIYIHIYIHIYIYIYIYMLGQRYSIPTRAGPASHARAPSRPPVFPTRDKRPSHSPTGSR